MSGTIFVESQEQLSSKHQLDAIFESSQDGLYLTDGQGYTLRVNTAYEKMTGYSREILIGKHMSWLEKENMISESVSLQVLAEKKSITKLQRIGANKQIMVTSTPVFDENQNIVMVVSNARDITYLKTIEEELEKARRLTEKFSGEIADSRPSEAEFLITESPAMKNIINLVHQIAPFPTTILLRGESGVGKEIIASLIHHYSKRSHLPFIKINCTAIPETLLESELFGYERGAFSGANKEGKPGLLELAHGGTVLLDEIGDMPLHVQTKILRVIQERELRRVGGTKSIPVDIRILSATNKDLKEMVTKKQFREDLYYRLNVIDIFIPPLRERKENIRPLIRYYLQKYVKDYRIQKEISKETIYLLEQYAWPGNIRELRNLVENLAVSSPSSVILPEHLPDYMKGHKTPGPLGQAVNPSPIEDNFYLLGLKKGLEWIEKHILAEALKKHKTIRKAAKQLNIDHSTFVRKMEKLGLRK